MPPVPARRRAGERSRPRSSRYEARDADAPVGTRRPGPTSGARQEPGRFLASPDPPPDQGVGDRVAVGEVVGETVVVAVGRALGAIDGESVGLAVGSVSAISTSLGVDGT